MPSWRSTAPLFQSRCLRASCLGTKRERLRGRIRRGRVGFVEGAVQSLSLFSTVLLTLDNVRITVPNGAVWGSTIRNMSALGIRRVDVTIGVAYEADIDEAKARAELAQAAAQLAALRKLRKR